MNYLKTKSREYPISELMKNLSADLYPLFIRIHRSYLVNVNLIEKINLKEGYLEVANTQLPIGKTYRNNILENLTIIK
jgi:DNA-binding LytR/AlgR family response regulator